MISGYFYNKESNIRQIRKIFIIVVATNLLYCIWNCIYGFISGNLPTITGKTIINFLIFNESPFGGHIWYLGTILYTLIIVWILDKTGRRRLLYYIILPLLISDLLLGKYSLLFFGKQFPYIIVRNWLFTGIPFFAIGMLMKEKTVRIGYKWIPIFIFTTILERYLLIENNINAVRDQYLSTIFLAIAVFSFALDYKGAINDRIAKIGKEYSIWIYILHPIFIDIFNWITNTVGINYIKNYIGPIFIFIITLGFIVIVSNLRYYLMSKIKIFNLHE